MPKISELNPLTSLSNDDLVPVVNDPNGSPSNNKITFDNFANSVYQNFDSKGVFDLLINAANTGNVSFSNTTITTRHNNQNLILTSQNGNVSIIPDGNFKWNFSDGIVELNSTEYGSIMGIGEGMGPVIYANGSLIVTGFYVNNETNEYWSHGSLAYPGNYQTTAFYANNDQYSYKESTITLRGETSEVSAKIHLDDGQNQFDWVFDSNGNITLPANGNILNINGNSVLSGLEPPTPNIEFTGVFGGLPEYWRYSSSFPKLQYSSNSSFRTTSSGLYWLDQDFDDGNYDLSGLTSIRFTNIGGIKGRLDFSAKSEVLLTTLDFGEIAVVDEYVSIAGFSNTLTTFAANNLVDVGGYFEIYGCQFNNGPAMVFPALDRVTGNFYIDYNYYNFLNTPAPSFPALTHTNNGMYIYQNRFTSWSDFTSLERIRYDFQFHDNTNNDDELFSGPGMPALINIQYGSLQYYQNAGMQSISEFSALDRIDNSIQIYYNSELESFPSFPALTYVAGINVYGNPLMNSLDGGNGFLPSILHMNGNVAFQDCGLDQASIDSILVKLASLDGTNGTTSFDYRQVSLNGGTNAIPSETGLTAKGILEARNCSVYVNS